MGYNPNKIVREMHANGRGISQLFEGLDAHLLSRVSYLFIRNTIYNDIYNRFKPHKPTNDLSYREKALIASFAGGIAAVVTNPLTVISVRQIIDTQLKDAWQRKYTSIFFGLL